MDSSIQSLKCYATQLFKLILRKEARKFNPAPAPARHCASSLQHFISLRVAAACVLGMTCLVGQWTWLYNCVPAILETFKVLSNTIYMTTLVCRSGLSLNIIISDKPSLISLNMVLTDYPYFLYETLLITYIIGLLNLPENVSHVFTFLYGLLVFFFFFRINS